MPQNGTNENILHSWKEISAYVGRDVRTCIRWEKQYGLPIHRLEAEARGKVFAYRDEIDRWLRERSEPAEKPAAKRRAWPVVVAAAVLLVAAIVVLHFRQNLGRRLFPGSRVPSEFHIVGSNLVVVNEKGNELWRWDAKLPNLEVEDYYRGHFQEKEYGGDYCPTWPFVMIRDIDGDGRVETLFSIQTKNESREGILLCFNEDGTERWPFAAGRALKFGEMPYGREYRIAGFDLCDFDGDGRLEIIVISWHHPDWPCQVVVLDTAKGDPRGEYWNKGYLDDYLFEDVDGDGTKEIVLSGVNNEYNRGCVVVFKGLNLAGVSPQDLDAYRTYDLGEGSESAYILCPETDVNQAIRRSADAINYLWAQAPGDGFRAVASLNQVFYNFDKELRCRGVTLSNYYKDEHRRLSAAGAIHSVLDDPEYGRGIRDGMLYREGGRWVAHPVPPESAREPRLPEPPPGRRPKSKR